MNKLIAIGFAFITLATATSAHAILRRPGTFVPSKCGAQESVNSEAITNILNICVGSIAVEGSDAVEFRLRDGSAKVFRAVNKNNLMQALRSGNVKSVVRLVGQDGKQITMKIVENAQGDVVMASGELDGEQYLVTAFESVNVIQ